ACRRRAPWGRRRCSSTPPARWRPSSRPPAHARPGAWCACCVTPSHDAACQRPNTMLGKRLQIARDERDEEAGMAVVQERTKEVVQAYRRHASDTGRMAKQAGGAALVQLGESVVLVTATALTTAREGIDFFPLTCDYQEKTFAAGKIPGGFFKREGRPAEKEILTSRLIDRPLRP